MLSAILSAIIFLGGGKSQKPRRRRAPQQLRARLQVEALESRYAPANFIVNAMTDTGTGTGNSGDLRYCIMQANMSGDDSSGITFDSSVSGTITLSSQLPILSKNITITGPGSDNLTVARSSTANNDFAIFWIAFGKTCEIDCLTISGGTDSGIKNFSTLTLCECTITNCTSDVSGGGIYNSGVSTGGGTLYLTATNVEYNQALGSWTEGGGIINIGGTVSCSDSTIYENSAYSGGGIYNESIDGAIGQITLDNTTVESNYAANKGGGIYNSSGTVTMTGGAIYSNWAVNQGGGVYNESDTMTFSGVAITANEATATNSQGGGFYLQAGTINFQNSSTLSGNTANTGPGGAYEASSDYSTGDCTLADTITLVS